MNNAQKNYRMEDRLKAQVQRINEVVLSYAKLDFSKRAEIEGSDDIIDALAAGINMLGEELQHSTVSLQEKEVLLKEVHHRVKNNLQIISSILRLQSEFSNSRTEKKSLEDCQNRIMSMALLHEKLYQSENLENIEICGYVGSIIDHLSESLSVKNVKIGFTQLMNKKSFHLDELIPIGLIMNELITNALIHAFDGQSLGEITVTIDDHGDEIHLIVHDNGKGFNPNDGRDFKNLGMELIESLVEQIDASFEYDFNAGTKAVLKCKLVREK